MTPVADLDFTDVCVLFALRRESGPFLRRFSQRPVRVFPNSGGLRPPLAWEACRRDGNRTEGRAAPAAGCRGRWLVVETGPGAGRTEEALAWLADAAPPRLVVAAGFCGALDGALPAGGVIAPAEIITESFDLFQTTWPAASAPGPARAGRLLTAARLIGDPSEKQELARRYGALAVDMESAAAARFCAACGIPFGCVRAVSDDAHTPLSPALLALVSNGGVSPWRLVPALCRSPSLVPEMARLARATRRAADRLADALAAMLGATSASGA